MPVRNPITILFVLSLAVPLAWVSTSPAAAAVTAENSEKSYSYFEDASKRFEKGEYRAAIIQLKNARKEDPGNLSALVLLGRVYLILGDAAAAEREFKSAQRLGADDETILMWIAESLLAQRKFQALIEEIPIGGHPPSLESKIRVMRGRAQADQGNLDDAEDLFKEAARLQPDAPESIVALASVYLRQGKLQLAEDQADLATAVAPDYSGGWKLKGEIRRLKQDPEGALEGYGLAISADPRDFVARTARASILLGLGRDEQAIEDIKVVRAAQPLDVHANYLYSIAMARKGETEKSEAAMQRAARALDAMGYDNISGHMPTLLLAGNIHFRLKRFDRAYDELSRYVRLVPNHAGARKMLGTIMLMRHESDKAVRVLEPAVKMRPNDPQLLGLLGSGYMKQKRFTEAATLLEKAAELAPDAVGLRTQLAMVNLATGERRKAVDNLKSASELSLQDMRPSVLMGFVYLKDKEFDKAMAVAKHVIRREPDNPIGYNMQGAAYIGLGDFSTARSSFERALKADRNNGTAHHNLAKLDLKEGKLLSAKQHYETAVNLNSADADAMSALASVAEKQGDIENAIRWLEKSRSSDSNRIPDQLRLIQLYLGEKQFKTALSVAREVSTDHPNNIDVLFALSRAMLANGDTQAARSTYRNMARVAGYNSRILLRVAKLQIAVRDLKEAYWSLQKAVKGDPKYLAAQAEFVLLDATLGNQDKALKRAANLRIAYPDKAIGYALAGDVLMQAKRFEEAVQAFNEGMKREPGPELAVRLYRARMQVSAGDSAGQNAAVSELENWLKANTNSVAAFRTLGAGYMAVGRLQEARKIFQALLASLPSDAAVLNNLAVIAIRQNDSQALDYAKKAHKLAPKEPAVLDTLGWALVQKGEPGRALQYLREASLRASREPEISYHLAVALHRQGRDEEALRKLKTALKLGQRFEGIEDARMLITKLGKTP